MAGFETSIFSPHPPQRNKKNRRRGNKDSAHNEFQQPIMFQNFDRQSESNGEVSMQSIDKTHMAKIPKNIEN